MNPKSIQRFVSNKILLPDHYGSRIYKDLKSYDFDVEILPDRKWVDLTKSLRIQSITTHTQDGILLAEFCGKLFINLNDAGASTCSKYIKKISKNYSNSFMFALSGYGDADMINFFDEDNSRIEPYAKNKRQVGEQLSLMAKLVGANSIIPSSSFHQYQREDSIWAQEYTTPLEAFSVGLDQNFKYFPPFCEIDCDTLEHREINPKKINVIPKKPEEFGDNYSDELKKDDLDMIKNYFLRKDFINNYFGFLNFRVGNKDNFIDMNKNSKKGITFTVPKESLMTAIKYRIFDDLLIGNFMKTTLHNCSSLYEGTLFQNFNFNTAKYADNGNAENDQEVKNYIKEYKKRMGYEFFLNAFEGQSKRFLTRILIDNPKLFEFSKKIYINLKK
tara:strand:- start:105 stop:1268 length:1164 start_codon:yes stop_codon:yes gene_type:complete